jgi:hypothetical protein
VLIKSAATALTVPLQRNVAQQEDVVMVKRVRKVFVNVNVTTQEESGQKTEYVQIAQNVKMRVVRVAPKSLVFVVKIDHA